MWDLLPISDYADYDNMIIITSATLEIRVVNQQPSNQQFPTSQLIMKRSQNLFSSGVKIHVHVCMHTHCNTFSK